MTASSERIEKPDLNYAGCTTSIQRREHTNVSNQEKGDRQIQEMQHQIKLLIEMNENSLKRIASLELSIDRGHVDKNIDQQRVNDFISRLWP